jgi:predicted nucleic acid-binding protein
VSRVFWDTNLFIYLLEDYGLHSEGVVELLAKMESRGDELLTSAITLGEILVQPSSSGDVRRCQEYEAAITENAEILPFDVAASRKYARIRSQPRKITPPDAIQLACAAAAGVDLFLTNDSRLHGLHVDGIQFITSVDRAPL